MLIKDIAYTIPYSIQWYNHIKKKYLDYSRMFSYPHTKLISFDDNRNVLLIERIMGKKYNDLKHHKLIIRKMIEYALEAPAIIKQHKYLQHGDVNASNIVWVNNVEPVFIDLDNLDYCAIMYDIIHYSSSCISAEQLVSILDQNITIVNQLFTKFGIKYNRHYLDCLFADYIGWYLKHLPKFYADYTFLYELNIIEFPNTIQLLTQKTNNSF